MNGPDSRPSHSRRDRLLAWAAGAPDEFVLGVPEHQDFVDGLAAEIGAELPDADALRTLEAEARALPEAPLSVELA